MMALNRKPLRFLKPLNHLQVISKSLDNHLVDSIVKWSVLVKNAGYFGYLSLDSLVWFKLLGLISAKKFQKAKRYGDWLWFIGLCGGLANDLRKLNLAMQTQKALSEETEKNESKKEVKTNRSQLESAKKLLLKDLLDAFIVLNNLDFLHYPDGLIGAAGTITSFMGLQEIWSNVKV